MVLMTTTTTTTNTLMMMFLLLVGDDEWWSVWNRKRNGIFYIHWDNDNNKRLFAHIKIYYTFLHFHSFACVCVYVHTFISIYIYIYNLISFVCITLFARYLLCVWLCHVVIFPIILSNILYIVWCHIAYMHLYIYICISSCSTHRFRLLADADHFSHLFLYFVSCSLILSFILCWLAKYCRIIEMTCWQLFVIY